jgi:hypothetical protein
MLITHYSFGNITVNGETYTKDVIIYPEHVYSPWWRKEGHLLQTPDLSEVVNAGVATLIIGTGLYGAMQVPEKILDYLKSKNIEAHVENTKEAVRLYNEISAKSPAIAALHLTC